MTALACSFTDHKNVWSSNSGQVQAFQENVCEHTFELIQVLSSCLSGHPSKDLRLCFTALSFCSPVRNTSQRMFEHVLPYRRNTQPFSREVFSHPGNFSVAPAEKRDSNIFISSSKKFARFTVTLSASNKIRDQEMKLVRQNQRLSSISSTWEPYSASFQAF